MMTTVVRGPIRLVTDRTDTVRKVSIRAPELRLHGAGIVTDHNDDIPVVGGQVEFEALPGPAVLTLVTAGGAPLRSVDIVVPDEETATLAECLDQIYVYEPPVIGRAQQFAREAGEHATTAQEIATNLPATIQNELDDRVPEALSADQTIRDAATLAVNDAVDAGLPGKADTSYVDAQDQALGQRIDGLRHYSGTGFPEGKVTAPVGATYTDTAATNGAVRWIKTAGTGNTGWQVEYGDTGWRRLDPVGQYFTGEGGIFFRRVGSLVTIRFSDVGVAMGETVSNVYLTDAYYMPAGFRVGYTDRPSFWVSNNNANPNYLITIAQGSRIRYQTSSAGTTRPGTGAQAMQGQGSWLTDDSWPSTLPGTPS